MTTDAPPVFSGKELRKARLAAGYTQREAARVLDVSRTTLFNAETGESTPGADLLARIAHLYGVEIGSLFAHAPDADTDADVRGNDQAPTASSAKRSAAGAR